MTDVRLLTTVRLAGGNNERAGTVVGVADDLAARLVAQGKATADLAATWPVVVAHEAPKLAVTKPSAKRKKG